MKDCGRKEIGQGWYIVGSGSIRSSELRLKLQNIRMSGTLFQDMGGECAENEVQVTIPPGGGGNWLRSKSLLQTRLGSHDTHTRPALVPYSNGRHTH